MQAGDERLEKLLFLNRLGSPRTVAVLLEEGLSLEEIIGRIRAKKISSGKTDGLDFEPKREIEKCEKLGICFLSFLDDDYPYLLKQIADPPLVLYAAGTLVAGDESSVAIVGTRRPSFYGGEQTRRFSRELAQKGLTIVSGFARGVDQAAHEACLEISYGRTVAVLGCGLDVDYPRGSRELFERVAAQGAVLSEFPLGTPPLADHFPKRNRIISGLSLGVLVVEAHERSGSLITAHEAADQGREVFAVPGMLGQLTSGGTHLLLKEGAHLAANPEDIFETLAPEIVHLGEDRAKSLKAGDPKRICKKFAEDPEGDKVISALTEMRMSLPEIAEKCFFPASAAAGLMTRLELGGKVRKCNDGKYRLSASLKD
jgi:DNA processing protein